MKKFLSKHLALLLFVSLLPQSINAESWTAYAKKHWSKAIGVISVITIGGLCLYKPEIITTAADKLDAAITHNPKIACGVPSAGLMVVAAYGAYKRAENLTAEYREISRRLTKVDENFAKKKDEEAKDKLLNFCFNTHSSNIANNTTIKVTTNGKESDHSFSQYNRFILNNYIDKFTQDEQKKFSKLLGEYNKPMPTTDKQAS